LFKAIFKVIAKQARITPIKYLKFKILKNQEEETGKIGESESESCKILNILFQKKLYE